MYAVIEEGSKQFNVSEFDISDIDLPDVSPDAETTEIDKNHCQSCEVFEVCNIPDYRGDCIEIVVL